MPEGRDWGGFYLAAALCSEDWQRWKRISLRDLVNMYLPDMVYVAGVGRAEGVGRSAFYGSTMVFEETRTNVREIYTSISFHVALCEYL